MPLLHSDSNMLPCCGRLMSTLLIFIRITLLMLCAFLILHASIDSQRFRHISFENPLLGFEARGNSLAKRVNTWNLLQKQFDQLFIRNPFDSLSLFNYRTASINLKKSSQSNLEKPKTKDKHLITHRSTPTVRSKNDGSDGEEESIERPDYPLLMDRVHFDSDRMWCGSPHEDYVHILLSSSQNNDLFTLRSLQEICNLDRMLRHEINHTQMNPSVNFHTYCEVNQRRLCCGSWTLANLAARLTGRQTCSQLQEPDVMKAKNIVQTCAKYYPETLQSEECTQEGRLCGMEANTVCAEHRTTLFALYHYLVDRQFVHGISRSLNTRLRKTAIFLPLAKSTHLLEYYESITHVLDLYRSYWSFTKFGYTKPILEIKSMDIGIYHALFDRHLLLDLRLSAVALFCTCLLIFVYSRSSLLTIVIFTIVSLSLLLAYYAYVYVLRIEFFPFMNMFAVLIAVAIGADNSFIFIQEHCQQKQLEQDQKDEFVHLKSYSTRTTFVGSFTTAAAFICSFYSHITAIRCFALFAALVTTCNFALTALFMPLCIRLVRRSTKVSTSSCKSNSELHRKSGRPNETKYNTSRSLCLRRFFGLIRWFAFPLVFFLFSTAIIAYYLILYYPGLRASLSEQSPLFYSNHHFERYAESRSDFAFDRINRTLSQQDQLQAYFLGQEGRARVIFGVMAQDTGFQLDPFDRGDLAWSSMGTFEPVVQRWLFHYCKALRNQSFYAPDQLVQFPGCFMDTFRNWMSERSCERNFGTESSYPCCNQSRFPYSVDVFSSCLIKYQQLLRQTPSQLVSRYGGVWFHRNNSNLHTNDHPNKFNFTQPQLLVIDFQLRMSVDADQRHTTMINVWNEFSNFHRHMLDRAPAQLRHGWIIVDHLDYFAFRVALLESIPGSIAIAGCLSGLAIVFATRSLALTVFAFTSICGATGCTIAFLVLLDWRLDVTEGIIITSAIGLSVDYTLHYAMCYKEAMQNFKSRSEAIGQCFDQFFLPIMMAGITTILVGISMCFAIVIVYVKIGIFLIVLTVVNWIYANLYFLPLLWLFTPGSLSEADSNEHLDHFADDYSNKRLYLWSNPALYEDSTDVFEQSMSSSEATDSKVLASASIVRDHSLVYHRPDKLQLQNHLQSTNSSYFEQEEENRDQLDQEEEVDERVESVEDMEEECQPSAEEQDFYDQISSGQSSPANANDDFQYFQSNYENYTHERRPQPHETEV